MKHLLGAIYLDDKEEVVLDQIPLEKIVTLNKDERIDYFSGWKNELDSMNGWSEHIGGKEFIYKFKEYDFTLNASASFSENENPIFSFNLGCNLSFDDYFSTLCSYSDFFSDIFTGDRFVFVGSQFETRFFDYSFLVGLSEKDIARELIYRVPFDEERIIFSIYLKNLAWSWIILHEENHYLMGHLHFLNSSIPDNSNTQRILSEVSKICPGELDGDISRGLEYQADIHAAISLVQLNLRYDEFNNIPVPNLRNEIGVIRVLLMSVGAVCLLFDKINTLNGKNSCYPSAEARLITVVMGIIQSAIQGSDFSLQLSRNDVIEALYMAINDINIAAKLLRVKPISMDIMKDLEIAGVLNVPLEMIKTDSVKEWRDLHIADKQELISLMYTHRCNAVPGMKEQLRNQLYGETVLNTL